MAGMGYAERKHKRNPAAPTIAVLNDPRATGRASATSRSLRDSPTDYPAGGIPALVLAVVFVVIGVYMVEVGRVMWTDSHNPRAVAHIDSRRCWTSTGGADGSSENLCDLVVTYRADIRTVRTSMKAVDAGGIHGDSITVSYDPANVSDTSGPENDSKTAFMAWGAAILPIGFGAWLIRSVIRQRSRPKRGLHVSRAS
jgi:hypothetical protein